MDHTFLAACMYRCHAHAQKTYFVPVWMLHMNCVRYCMYIWNGWQKVYQYLNVSFIVHMLFNSSKSSYLLQILVAKKGGTTRQWPCWITKIICQTSSMKCFWIVPIIGIPTWLCSAKDGHCGIADCVRDLYLTNLGFINKIF